MCGNAHGVKGTPQGVVGAWGEQCASTEPTHLLRAAAGDLAKINLGLKPEAYKRVAAEVDTIVHNGALVNHAFSYRQLFEPNVLGTVEIMKLAIATRVKALTFISSVGVAGARDRGGGGHRAVHGAPGRRRLRARVRRRGPPAPPCSPQGIWSGGRLRGACRSWTARRCDGVGTGLASVAELPCRPA